jgi:endonuclease III-like uncharacterized protein
MGLPVKQVEPAPAETLLRMHAALFPSFSPQGWWLARTGRELIGGVILTQSTKAGYVCAEQSPQESVPLNDRHFSEFHAPLVEVTKRYRHRRVPKFEQCSLESLGGEAWN